MAAKTHYETLGLTRSASAGEVRSAYRKLVLRHHPDRSRDAESPALFLAATEAYEVLSDPERRRAYDANLEAAARRTAERERVRSEPRRTQPRAAPTAAPIAAEVARLTLLFSKGRVGEAERLARAILDRDPRQPIPYAVLGDVARARHEMEEAARLYAVALQMDPRNALYLRRYEELLARSRRTRPGERVELGDRRVLSLIVFMGVISLASAYLIASDELPAMAALPPVSSWTIGLMVMLFLGGVAAGACLAAGDLLDRLDASASLGPRRAPTVTLGLVAIVSYPAAVALYLLLGLALRGFHFSTTRFLVGVGVVTAALGLAASVRGVELPQVLLWGGNLVYMGALCGWTISDSFRS